MDTLQSAVLGVAADQPADGCYDADLESFPLSVEFTDAGILPIYRGRISSIGTTAAMGFVVFSERIDDNRSAGPTLGAVGEP